MLLRSPLHLSEVRLNSVQPRYKGDCFLDVNPVRYAAYVSTLGRHETYGLLIPLQIFHTFMSGDWHQGSILSTFYEQLLRAQIPKVQKSYLA